MSNVNIKRAVANIRSTTIYTPIIELVVNSIQAIEQANVIHGKIEIIALREKQIELNGSLPSISGFKIKDNGIGFTENNRNSFDTLYSDLKISQGGKGFGRFTCLKYFENLFVESIYFEDGYNKRTFSMGKENEIIVKEDISPTKEDVRSTVITLDTIKKKNSIDKKLDTIARSLVEMLLPYFITDNYKCPKIVLKEEGEEKEIVLNSYIGSSKAVITEVQLKNNTFYLGSDKQSFQVRTFKIFSPKNKVSKISLVADKREVTETPIHNYISEFSEEFYENNLNNDNLKIRNYILKSYVFSDYLDLNVSLERGEFEFKKDDDMLHGISQSEIEKEASELTKLAVFEEILSRENKKQSQIMSYVEDEAPWHKSVVNEVDFSDFPCNPSNEVIESRLQLAKYNKEAEIRSEVRQILQCTDSSELQKGVAELVDKISTTSQNDLIHYVATRKKVLEIFKKSLEIEDAKYAAESVVHDIIFPTKKDCLSVDFEEHNLWIIDERLNFTNYVSSDLPLNGGRSERPDVLIYGKRVAFRSDNESSNPISIFEFKKPGRDDFVNQSSKEDPVQQIIRYVNSIRAGKYKTPSGRDINIAENTPFYGYIICDTSSKVKTWLTDEKNFKIMPDGMGWFYFHEKINLYIEVMSWDKLLKDAEMRNRVFFHKLGINV